MRRFYAREDREDADKDAYVFTCDLCSTVLDDWQEDKGEDSGLFHMSGTVDGKFGTHIHLCKPCYKDIPYMVHMKTRRKR